MARPRLRHPGQPLALQVVLRILEFFGSLQLAVITLSSLVVVLAVATFVEKGIGPVASQFGVYQTWWFYALGTLLGVNVLMAALLRFPWKRHQTGFVITHAGIIVLLIGSLISALYGIEATLGVMEGDVNHVAVKDSHHFELEIPPSNGTSTEAETETAGNRSGPRRVKLPFRAGPFSWRDYAGWRYPLWAPPGQLPALPWQLASRDQGVVFDQDGIRLEVLDYYADSDEITGGLLTLYERGRHPEGGFSDWQPITLRLQPSSSPFAPDETVAFCDGATLPNGVRLNYLLAESQAEAEAFRYCIPRETGLDQLGEWGIAILYAGGKRFVLPLDETVTDTPIPLGATGIEVTVRQYIRRLLAVQLEVSRAGSEPEMMVLFADRPNFCRQAREHQVFGAMWVDPASLRQIRQPVQFDEQATAGIHHPRIDICQTPEGKLLARSWRPGQPETFDLPLDRSIAAAFPGDSWETRLVVDTLVPYDAEERIVVPLPSARTGDMGRRPMQTSRARVRLTVDGNEEEMWLAAVNPEMGATGRGTVVTCAGDDRLARLRLTTDTFDTGFYLRLERFFREMDPGTRQPSYYASKVDLLLPVESDDVAEPSRNGEEVVFSDDGVPLKVVSDGVMIELNHPVPFTDPKTGRMYRVYQTSFRGPFQPGDPLYPTDLAGRERGGGVYVSFFTLNYDPGRGLKYFGSLMIVAGIAVMFFMKAYFFGKRETPSKWVAGHSSGESARSEEAHGSVSHEPVVS